ncbi:LacI family transcriptional regulator [Victivallis vadensis]|uniref:LacI family transcriptional regulator n=1 Tax=Victivallis vadensis TaxID=172901 RepID=A0A848AZU4_9BACT|nr:LacI family DNA-binding transcriptional regulator [Victivallis vadensis]NMD86186.1 LacI family transcriptional regulator [Victivallis vadensis]
MRNSSKITLADVAREVGCSKSAVSYAILRNHPIGDALRKRIFEAIDRLGYQPYGSRSRTSRKVVILLTDQWASAREISLFQEKLRKNGLLCQQYQLPRYADALSDQEDFYRFLNHNSLVAGIICLHPDINSFDLIKRCKNIPATIFCREDSMLSSSWVQLEALAKLSLNHLLWINSPRVAFVKLEEPAPYAAKIFSFMRQDARLATHGISLELFSFPMNQLKGNSLTAWLEQARAEGIRTFLTNHVALTTPILQWAYRHRWYIPDDLSLFSIDYCEMSGQCVPPLTAVAVPLEKLIDLTIEELLCKIEGKPFLPKTLEPVLIDRGSTRSGR